MIETLRKHVPRKSARTLRLGFSGVGWIGRNRLDAAFNSGNVEIAAVSDPDRSAVQQVVNVHPSCVVADDFESLLELDLDGMVIATPSAMHAAQAMAALKAGFTVFCQKPLGRDAAETEQVIDTAKSADLLLGVDLSYRHTEGMRRIRELILEGHLGEITAIEAVFHNAYGPDKEWFYQRSKAGGGCLLDLGIHLVDLALWGLGFPKVEQACGLNQKAGRGDPGDRVEIHSSGLVSLAGGTQLLTSCSWGAFTGSDAEIRLQFFGTRGGACFRNVNGSFYDFVAEQYGPGGSKTCLASPPDDWGGGAIRHWVHELVESPAFRSDICHLTQIARVLDLLYGRISTPATH